MTRAGSFTICLRSNSWIRLSLFGLVHDVISLLKSPISRSSNPVACAIESSSSNRSIQFESAFGGRYTVQTRNG